MSSILVLPWRFIHIRPVAMGCNPLGGPLQSVSAFSAEFCCFPFYNCCSKLRISLQHTLCVYIYIHTHTHADVILFPTKDKQNTKQSFNQQFYFYVRRPTQISSTGNRFQTSYKRYGIVIYHISLFSIFSFYCWEWNRKLHHSPQMICGHQYPSSFWDHIQLFCNIRRGRGYRQRVKFFFLNKYSILAYQHQTETVILLIKAILLAMLDCLTVL